MKKRLGWLSDKLNLAGGFLGGLCILIMGCIVTYEVLVRYLFDAPTTWVLEISIYLCIASVFLAGGYALREKHHIQVDLITSKLSQPNQVLFQAVSLFMALVYTVILTWKGGEMTIHSFLMHEVSPTVLNVPVVIPHSFVLIGGFLLILEFVRQIWDSVDDLRKWKDSPPGGKRGWVEFWPTAVFICLIGIGAYFFTSRGLAPLGIVVMLFVLIFGGLPIAFGLGLIGLFGFYFTFGGGPMLVQVPMVIYKYLDDFIIAAVPLFIMLSAVLSVGEIGASLFDLASKWVRQMPGGLGVATIASSTIFAAMCGSSVATVATIGLIAIPEMISRGYNKRLVYGTVAIGGVLGPLIPPSLFMILIGAITGDSVGKLFMAGMFPGLMLAGIFALYIVFYCLRDRSMAKVEPAPWSERWSALRKAFWGLMAPILILGGIYTGVFTPTEAAGVGIVYSLVVCLFIQRTVDPKRLWKIVLDGGMLSATILFIVTGAVVFGQLITMLQIPDRLFGFVSTLPLSPMTVLFLTLGVILFLGALMDEVAILLITYPILYHVFVRSFGFDSIWFALVFVFTLEVGLVLPPVGINIFVVQGIWKDAKFEEVTRGVLPFALLMVAAILLVVYVKPLSLWLPELIG
ncbi:MAG: Sialic acid TRAP transporter permease protein SiaT [Syntrophaceae bacterium PtaU1.Bin231]|nr:MAG: Sialic acid TRAP transporter permease protein SiaT [Syntrophaceae bacterium PtaU1.Bin231]